MKEEYMEAVMEIVIFNTEDIIITSLGLQDDFVDDGDYTRISILGL